MLPVFEYKVAYNYHPIAETFSHNFFGQSLVHRKKTVNALVTPVYI